MKKKIFMIAGPNGAGKTTTALSLIEEGTMIDEFINADEIARGLAPLNPSSMALTASKLMIKRLRELLAIKKNFAFETTAAGSNYIKYLKEARRNTYSIHVFFLWLSSPELAIQRVAQRVEQGGHDIPKETIKRRFYSGLKNLVNNYLPLADNIVILNNSFDKNSQTVAMKKEGEKLQIKDPVVWKQIEALGNESKKRR